MHCLHHWFTDSRYHLLLHIREKQYLTSSIGEGGRGRGQIRQQRGTYIPPEEIYGKTGYHVKHILVTHLAALLLSLDEFEIID